jgi:FixJ family two-component response regulator
VLKALHPDWLTIEVDDARQALTSVDQKSPDFVLLDFNMPGKDGLTLAAELQELNLGIGVAVISANHQVEVVEQARVNGAVFIRKPLSERSLAEFFNGHAGQGKPAV